MNSGLTQLIDCNSGPRIPEGWKLASHTKIGSVEWDPSKVLFFVTKKQVQSGHPGVVCDPEYLLKELSYQRVMPANVLDFLLDNPEFIPEGCKDRLYNAIRHFYFFGTTYINTVGEHCVRGFYWDGVSKTFVDTFREINQPWYLNEIAVVLNKK